jgi:peptidoglycan biosynthesis protein MviN/MurJ (putative lipid II flippase)
LVKAYLKIFITSVVMAAATWGTMHGIANLVDMSRYWGVFTQALVSCLVAVVVYLGLNYALGSEEINWALRRKINSGQKYPKNI